MDEVPFDARAVVRTAAIVAGFLIVTTVVFEVGAEFAPDNTTFVNGRSVFSMREEHNLGAYGSTLLLLACALAAGSNAWLSPHETRLWGIIAVGFAALGADEMLIIHERFGRVADAVLGDSAPSFSWIVPGALVVVVLAAVLVPQLLRLPTGTWQGLLVAAGVFLFGALGLEAVGSALYERDGVPSNLAGGVSLVEEALEVIGATVALWAMVGHLERHLLPVRVVPGPTPVRSVGDAMARRRDRRSGRSGDDQSV